MELEVERALPAPPMVPGTAPDGREGARRGVQSRQLTYPAQPEIVVTCRPLCQATRHDHRGRPELGNSGVARPQDHMQFLPCRAGI
jgi:hypothetical protein